MKKLVLAIAIASFASFSNAQTVKTPTAAVASSGYEKAMAEKIKKIELLSTPEEFTALANDFARIGTKENSQWLPYYYAAFTTLQKGRALQKANKIAELDGVADEAQKYLDAAVALSPENAELYILSKMIHRQRMLVNPMERFMTEGRAAADALAKAERLDPENPRIALLKAEDTYYTPEQFGGSKTKGLEQFQTAKDKFAAYKAPSALAPNWGAAEAEYFLNMK